MNFCFQWLNDATDDIYKSIVEKNNILFCCVAMHFSVE